MTLENLTPHDLLLPDPLRTNSGEKVSTPDHWQNTRRSELLELFRDHVYGHTPVGRPDELQFELKQNDTSAMGGKATLKRVDIHFAGAGGKGVLSLTLFIPNHITKPAPGFLLICNKGREHIDPTRVNKSSFWPAEQIVERGYAALAFHNSDLDPDIHDGFKNGVHGIFDPENPPRCPHAWGTIAAWAWGGSRVMDYLETDVDIDEKQIAVVGHSRGGKAALWCGSEDERFALVISNNSGCAGAALTRNMKGERIKDINGTFPHWFCEMFKTYNEKEQDLPVDQHELLALIAPRPVYVASATLDEWADPEGEFLSCVHAGPVYQLFGLEGVGEPSIPVPQQPYQTGSIGYHLRIGKHDMTEYDWHCYMNFADRHWGESLSFPAP